VTQSENRPWGSWHILDEADGFKVKRLVVSPGSRLSLQMHEHRAEHWVVVAGAATCTVGDETVVLEPGGAVDIAVGQAHRIANQGEETLVIIEVQRGSYTGEDDIVRLEDDYGRVDLTRS
jgi:mannose-6-phosphate isomerase-like protein (cupin superfamily)